MSDLSSIPTDERGVPTISPQEMLSLLDQATDHSSLNTAQQIRDDIRKEIDQLEKQGFRSSDPNEIFREISERKKHRSHLEARLEYWNQVAQAALQTQQSVSEKKEGKNKYTEIDRISLQVLLLALGLVIIFVFLHKCNNASNDQQAEKSVGTVLVDDKKNDGQYDSSVADTTGRSLEERKKAISDRVSAALANPSAVYDKPGRETDFRGKPRTTLAEKNRYGSHRFERGNVYNNPNTGEVSQVTRYLENKYSGMAYDALWWSEVRFYDATSEYVVRHKYSFVTSLGRTVYKDQIFVFDRDGFLTDVQEWSDQ